MKSVDSIDLQPCRCELMQMAIDGAAWSTLSMEHLLDRVMDTPLHGPEPAHFQSKNEGTS
jgi:hypothetical protein